MGGVVFIVATLIAYVAGHLTLSSLPTAQIAQVGPTMTALVLLGVFVFSGAIGFMHHHFELKGWSEVNVVIRFWIIAGMVAAIGLGIFYGDFLAATS